MDIKRVQIQCDYETANRAGVSGAFQVTSIIVEKNDGSTEDLSSEVDAGQFYYSRQELLNELKLAIADEIIEWD